jgi:predicted TIM-barrel fold metal-dependent hydrolase
MRYVIVSADCHAGLPTLDYREYLDPTYRNAYDSWYAEGQALRKQMASANPEFLQKWEEENEEGLRGGWDAERRDKELDADGVAGEVLFPNADAAGGGSTTAPFGAGLGMSGELDPELLMAGARAHNRWLVELCATSPERRAGLALVPHLLFDPQRAVEEIKWARENGLRGIMIPSQWAPQAPYHDPCYEPVWAACQDFAMPIHTHSGGGGNDYGGFVGMFSTEFWFYPWRPMWFLLWSGVFERFPNLTFVASESGAFPAPNVLWYMDTTYLREHNSKKLDKNLGARLTMKPSDYFDRNVFLGASTMKRRELAMRYEIGVGNLMWGNDFPHPEGTWPHTADWLKKNFHDVPVDECRRILGETALRVYGFDEAALGEIASRVGPTPDDLGQTDQSQLAKWDEARRVGRHWVTDLEPIPVTALAAERAG